MTQFEFDKLLERYLAGACNDEEKYLIETWSDKQITANTTMLPLNYTEEKEIETRLKKRIDVSINRSVRFSMPFVTLHWGVGVALISLLTLGTCFLIKSIYTTSTTSERAMGKMAGFELSNTTHSEQEFNLKDGSTITLQPQSNLTYLENFGIENRIVFLKGEGYFQVKSDSMKPFYVYAGNLVTKVLGTKFTVKSYTDGKQGEVIVKSGKVMVYEKQQGKYSKAIVLKPNQKIMYNAAKPNIIPQIVDNPVMIHPLKQQEDFVFEKTPIKTVLERLKNIYGIDILTKNQAFDTCLFTGNLNGLMLYEQLDLICQCIGAKYQTYETAIWLEGDGCNE